MKLHANLSFVYHQVAERMLNINALLYALKNEIAKKDKNTKKRKKEKIGFSSVCLCTRDLQCSRCSSILLIDSVSKPYIYLISLDTGADPQNSYRGGRNT